MRNRAVFLDRDGVINPFLYNAGPGALETPANPAEFHLIPGARKAIAEFNHLDLPVIVFSFQSGIANGKLTPALLDEINDKICAKVAEGGAFLDTVLCCRHHPDATLPECRPECDCRKPRPGLFFRAAREYNLDLGASFFIGHDVPGVLAGRAAGVTTILLSPHRYILGNEFSSRGAIPHLMVQQMAQAVSHIREAIAGVHLLVLHPTLKAARMKWESAAVTPPTELIPPLLRAVLEATVLLR
jgi:histidinol-phosphate phosphatase family protein